MIKAIMAVLLSGFLVVIVLLVKLDKKIEIHMDNDCEVVPSNYFADITYEYDLMFKPPIENDGQKHAQLDQNTNFNGTLLVEEPTDLKFPASRQIVNNDYPIIKVSLTHNNKGDTDTAETLTFTGNNYCLTKHTQHITELVLRHVSVNNKATAIHGFEDHYARFVFLREGKRTVAAYHVGHEAEHVQHDIMNFHNRTHGGAVSSK